MGKNRDKNTFAEVHATEIRQADRNGTTADLTSRGNPRFKDTVRHPG
jgi:hypothetical protein